MINIVICVKKISKLKMNSSKKKKMLYTTSVKVTDDDDHVLLDEQDCKPCGFKFKTIVNMKAYLVTSVKGFTAIVNYSRSTLIKFIWI